MSGEFELQEKIICIKDEIDSNETNGHVDDDVACFARPGEVVCICMYTDAKENPFYQACQDTYKYSNK